MNLFKIFTNTEVNQILEKVFEDSPQCPLGEGKERWIRDKVEKFSIQNPLLMKLDISDKPIIEGDIITEDDIGSIVAYVPDIGEREIGIISSINEDRIFVKFSFNGTGQLCPSKNLKWARNPEELIGVLNDMGWISN